MLRDPVTGFEYPAEWVRACQDPARLPQVERGLAVLTASGSILRRGFTTGTTAAAAAKAAVLSLLGEAVTEVEVLLPCGIAVVLPVSGAEGRASCCKDAGDYPDDATAGVEIIAEARWAPGGIRITAREGIGRWTRDTPHAAQG
ncbi:MAG TPA: cobalt-precorrin-5B (C(1))-methyltransferase, partial [Methanomicrobiales archaeon]|nr:cobalt-precorrin-5B (C(1))-methyltransferase [Methanomicrobiales archaeon]